ncbi:50S ribosomal protein L1 [Nitzschia inconspicua]|uniref:50S ribosomal protein L1 n=1 Tax=Nitzschia inconspicua TaxID=303405 RepID=A0A9K3LHY8_9STRA|nr:50S ribosomal protein L1 [Nitzschia inconspicua]
MFSRSAVTLQRRLVPFSSRIVDGCGCYGGSTTTTGTTPIQHAVWNLYNQSTSSRSYVSRAHPRTTPEYPVAQALEMILNGIEERKVLRADRWERNQPKRQSKGQQDTGPYKNQDETVELSINLNVDPRRPGQALRGSLTLPHGTGKTVSCLVFTSDPAAAKRAEEVGHKAGGEDLVDRIIEGKEPLDAYQRAMATKEILPLVQKKLARLLGPRGLMPNPKTNTIFDDGEELLKSLTEVANTVTYRTDASGILHFVLGKGSFSSEQLLDNLRTICQTVQDIKPETYGKGKKKKSSGSGSGKKKPSKNVKYWLRAHLTATQSKGSIRMDLRSVDPTSPFFMKEPE